VHLILPLVDLFSVTVHELGHSLGLMHSNIPDAIMFPYYRGYSKSIKLHSDDIVAIRKLYGGNSKADERKEVVVVFVRSSIGSVDSIDRRHR
jgi:hypothetical protein